MPIIDPDGYFGGDRFDDVTDMARAMWPSFFLASNTVGRFEVHYRKVCASAFSRWSKKPTEAQFWGWVHEYRDAYLLFVYEVDGQVWGQWDTSEKFLPRHKLAADLRSPAATAKDFLDWKSEYVSRKAAKSNGSNNFVKFPKIAKVFESPQKFCGNVRGVGVGVGVGVGENPLRSESADVDDSPIKPEKQSDEIADWFEKEFYPIYPRKKAKDAALKASRAKFKTPELRTTAIRSLRFQLAEFALRDSEKIPYPATWINSGSWKDEQESIGRSTTQNGYALFEPYEPPSENE